MPDSTPAANEQSVLPRWISIFLNHPGMTVGSLIAAVIIFFYIRGMVEDRVFISVTPDLTISAEENYVITRIRNYKNTVVTDELQLSLRGPLSKLETIKRNEEFRIEKTISPPENWKPGEQFSVEITEKNLKMKSGNLPLGIHMEPRKIKLFVTVEKLVQEERPILSEELENNINRFLKGQPASDYRVSDMTSKIRTVEITGPRKQVQNMELVPTDPINVIGNSSSVTKLVRLRPSIDSDRISISPETVRITVHITSKMTKRTIEVPYQISMWKELFQVIKKRGWNISQDTLTLTLRVPRTIKKESLGADTILPVVILKTEDLNILKKPKGSLSISPDKVHVIFSEDLQKREMIEVEKIQTEDFYFESTD